MLRDEGGCTIAGADGRCVALRRLAAGARPKSTSNADGRRSALALMLMLLATLALVFENDASGGVTTVVACRAGAEDTGGGTMALLVVIDSSARSTGNRTRSGSVDTAGFHKEGGMVGTAHTGAATAAGSNGMPPRAGAADWPRSADHSRSDSLICRPEQGRTKERHEMRARNPGRE